MIVLDDRQLRSRLDQALQGLRAARSGNKQGGQAVVAAKAAFEEAASEFERVRKYYESQAATLKELEQAESAYQQAEAGLKQAREAMDGTTAGIRQAEEVVKEAQIALGYAKIVAPEAGEVLERLAEPGDMALPGKALVGLRTSGSLRIEAHVREGLVRNVTEGTRLPVTVTILAQTVDATVEEIVPYADPKTRTFLVKASLPEISGLFPGMYGKLLVPVQAHPAVMVPAAAVRKVGQLELITVREGDRWRSVYIKTGRSVGDKREVLSGLAGGEQIGWED
jgi:RND family efflux transporter MFP subunit